MIKTLVLAGLVGAASVLAGGAAQAQTLGNTLEKIFNFGGDSDPPAINYSERAPLVVPPKRVLPQPGSEDALASDPNWPKDPDEAKRRALAKEAKGGIFANRDLDKDSEQMTPEERAAGTLNGDSADTRSEFEIEREYKELQNPVNPKVLARKGTFGSTEPPVVLGTEPARTSLIDPPAGMRIPSSGAPIGGDEPLPSEQSQKQLPWYKRLNLFN